MVTKAKLDTLKKQLEKVSEPKEKLFLSSSDEKPGFYFVDALDTDRAEPVGKVYTEQELEELKKQYEVIVFRFVDVDMSEETASS